MKFFSSLAGNISPNTGPRLRRRFAVVRYYETCREAGFTLIELMIVVAIIAILTAIAYPSYISYITKTHRVAAEGCLSEHANYMERYYTTNLSYSGATIPGLGCASAQQTGANYSYTLPSAATSSAYTVTATPINAQLTRDTKCGALSIDQSGARTAATGDTTCW